MHATADDFASIWGKFSFRFPQYISNIIYYIANTASESVTHRETGSSYVRKLMTGYLSTLANAHYKTFESRKPDQLNANIKFSPVARFSIFHIIDLSLKLKYDTAFFFVICVRLKNKITSHFFVFLFLIAIWKWKGRMVHGLYQMYRIWGRTNVYIWRFQGDKGTASSTSIFCKKTLINTIKSYFSIYPLHSLPAGGGNAPIRFFLPMRRRKWKSGTGSYVQKQTPASQWCCFQAVSTVFATFLLFAVHLLQL